jgi:hypothetical protein
LNGWNPITSSWTIILRAKTNTYVNSIQNPPRIFYIPTTVAGDSLYIIHDAFGSSHGSTPNKEQIRVRHHADNYTGNQHGTQNTPKNHIFVVRHRRAEKKFDLAVLDADYAGYAISSHTYTNTPTLTGTYGYVYGDTLGYQHEGFHGVASIFSRPLAWDEVDQAVRRQHTSLCQAPGIASAMIGHWDLNQSAGTVIPNRSPNKLLGDLTLSTVGDSAWTSHPWETR